MQLSVLPFRLYSGLLTTFFTSATFQFYQRSPVATNPSDSIWILGQSHKVFGLCSHVLACVSLHHYIYSFEPSYFTILLPFSCGLLLLLVFFSSYFSKVGHAVMQLQLAPCICQHDVFFRRNFEFLDDVLHPDTGQIGTEGCHLNGIYHNSYTLCWASQL